MPNPARVIDYNRFLYVRGNPFKYTDPTGHSSALGPAWVQEFTDVHGRAPKEQDQADRLFSLAVPGSGPGGSWRDSDWIRYTAAKKAVENLFASDVDWFVGQLKTSVASEQFKEIAEFNQQSITHVMAAMNLPFSEEALIHLLVAGHARVEAYMLWRIQVKSGGPWDFKVRERFENRQYTRFGDYGYDRDIWGNIHYGFIGTALGFTSFELLGAAGVAHAMDNGFQSDLIGSNFDDPKDQSAIQMGIYLYTEYGLNIDEAKFWEAFSEFDEHLNRAEWK